MKAESLAVVFWIIQWLAAFLDQCPKHALQTQLEIIYVCLLSGSYDYINIGRILCSHLFSPPSGLSKKKVSEAVAGRDLGFCLC